MGMVLEKLLRPKVEHIFLQRDFNHVLREIGVPEIY